MSGVGRPRRVKRAIVETFLEGVFLWFCQSISSSVSPKNAMLPQGPWAPAFFYVETAC